MDDVGVAGVNFDVDDSAAGVDLHRVDNGAVLVVQFDLDHLAGDGGEGGGLRLVGGDGGQPGQRLPARPSEG